MPRYTSSAIRNVALLGHGGSGKTTLTEALLAAGGAIHKIGTVENKDTVSDYNDEERAHGHSLFTSVTHLDHGGIHVNLIDTPGYGDFVGQALSALPAVETVAVVISASAGIEPMARRMLQRAKERNLCRMIIINKIDAENIDLAALLDQIRETFGSECLPINLPADGGKRVIDVFSKAQGDADVMSVDEAHTAIIDQIVEVDESLMEKYLASGEEQMTAEDLHNAFEAALRQGHLIPICFTAARPHNAPDKPVGIRELLDVIEHLAPAPEEGNPRPFLRGEGEDAESFFADPDPDKHVIAHVFHVTIDPFLGKLAMFRVHQGTITTESQLFVGDARKPFKVGHLFKLQGKEHVEVDAGIPGDICAVAKVEDIHFDAVLHDSHDEDHLRLKPLAFPVPMQGLAITSKKRGDEGKIAEALHKIVEEDPTFSVDYDESTHETVIHGIGDLHLRVLLERLKNKYKIEVDTHPPKIAYRETITNPADGHHRHKKQTGGAGQFGEVFLKVEPLERGAGFVFENKIFGGAIPGQFVPAIEKGVKQALREGFLAGFPIQDVKVIVHDGKHHPVDSKEIAFVNAGKRAFFDAFQKARPVLLEPMVHLDVTAPQQFMGDITGDLSGKRGRIQGTDVLAGDMAVIRAIVPLSEIAGYGNQLKSATGGLGSFTMELSHYDPVPPHVQDKVASGYERKADED